MVSIVVPVLNEGKLLPDCLRSLREQDYPGEVEIIVVDNGSEDDSVAVARRFGAKVVFSPKKRNVFYARDFGAWSARGEVIVQADGDTVYPRDWLTRIMEHFQAHPKVVAVSGVYTYRTPTPWERLEFWLRFITNIVTLLLFGRPFVVSGANFAFRREAFLKVGGYDLRAYAPDQYGIVTQLRKAGKIVYDRTLVVATSPRKFRKPRLVLATACLRHLCRGATHMLTDWVRSWQPVRQPSLRISLTLLPLVALVSFVGYGYFIPSSQVFGKVYYKIQTPEKLVALTFDDGPNDPYTSQILDTLKLYDVKATFFVTGYNVGLYPETARRMVSEGHVVGNHSYYHNANHALTQLGSDDLKLAQLAIFSTLGVVPHLYRPPHGKKSPWELQSLKKQKLEEVTWSISTSEQRNKPAEALAREIVTKTSPGGIILLHDGYGNEHDTPRANKTVTVQALPLILDALLAKGYRFVTVPELLDLPAYNQVFP